MKKNQHQSSTADDRAALLKKPALWFAGVVVAALGVAITNALVPEFGRGIARIVEQGEPVTVDNIRLHQHGGLYMAFPIGVHFTDSEAVELGLAEDQWAVISSRGATPVGVVNILLTVSGNRQEKVRIQDLTAEKECTEPLTGAYFESPAAGAVPSIELFMDLDEPQPRSMDSPPWYPPEDSNTPSRSYFDTNTVELEKDEQVVFAVVAHVDESFCSFELEMSVLEGDTVRVQRINYRGESFKVTPGLPRSAWEQAFIGGVGCNGPVTGFARASDSWRQGDDSNPCILQPR
jgi:hypothetical protein